MRLLNTNIDNRTDKHATRAARLVHSRVSGFFPALLLSCAPADCLLSSVNSGFGPNPTKPKPKPQVYEQSYAARALAGPGIFDVALEPFGCLLSPPDSECAYQAR